MAPKKQVRVESVIFKGTPHDLKAHLLKWNSMRGVEIRVAPNDYVGGSFAVTFSRPGGIVEQREADEWVANAMKHAAE